MSRCLYDSNFEKFSNISDNSILGTLCKSYHGVALTTTIDAWKGEIAIMKDVLVLPFVPVIPIRQRLSVQFS